VLVIIIIIITSSIFSIHIMPIHSGFGKLSEDSERTAESATFSKSAT
jgi:hypothetical protein